MRRLYGTTTELVVTLAKRFFRNEYRLYFADNFNEYALPPSSNPFRLFRDFSEIFAKNDLNHPKFAMHVRGVRRGIRRNLVKGTSEYDDAMGVVERMGTHAVKPYLAILEFEEYERHHGAGSIVPVWLSRSGSPTAGEYLVDRVRGPGHPDAEMHLQRMHD